MCPNLAGNDNNSESMFLKIADRNREFEIQHYWIRTAFFGAIVAATFVGLHNLHENSFFAFPICAFGVVCSFCWVLANRGAKFWQDNWEAKADALTENYYKEILAREKLNLTGPLRYSVSKLILLLSYFVLIAWYLFFFDLCRRIIENPTQEMSSESAILIFIGVHIFLILIAWLGRSGPETMYTGTLSNRSNRSGIMTDKKKNTLTKEHLDSAVAQIVAEIKNARKPYIDIIIGILVPIRVASIIGYSLYKSMCLFSCSVNNNKQTQMYSPADTNESTYNIKDGGRSCGRRPGHRSKK